MAWIVKSIQTINLPSASLSFRFEGTCTIGYIGTDEAAGNRSDVSAPRTLKIFSGTAPTEGQVVADTTPAFKWNGVSGLGVTAWTLQIASDAAMTTNLYTSQRLLPSATTFTLPTPRTPGLYYWRVIRAGEDANQIQGLPFYIANTQSEATPVLMQPVNGRTLNADDIRLSPSLEWTAPQPYGCECDPDWIQSRDRQGQHVCHPCRHRNR